MTEEESFLKELREQLTNLQIGASKRISDLGYVDETKLKDLGRTPEGQRMVVGTILKMASLVLETIQNKDASDFESRFKAMDF